MTKTLHSRRIETVIGRLNPQRVFTWGVFISLALGILQASFFLFKDDRFNLVVSNDILAIVSGLSASAGMAYGAWWSWHLDRRLGRTWLLFSLAMICWAIGDTLWAYYELIISEVPYPFIGDLFYLMIYPLFFIGVLGLVNHKQVSPQATWLWLDFFIVFLSALGIYWNFLIGPSWHASEQPWQSVLVSTAYPIGDLLLIMAVTLIIFLPLSPAWRLPMFFMLAGHILTAVADSIFNYQSINEIYESSSFFNILFSLGPLVLMLSGLSQAVVARQVILEERTLPMKIRSDMNLPRLIAPVFWLILALAIVIFNPSAKQAFPQAQFSVWVMIIIILFTFRQILATLENSRLAWELQTMNNQLEKHVAERTSDLVLRNAELRSEMEERKRIEIMLREREEKLTHVALHDPLTGLANRALLFDRISQSIQHYQRTNKTYAVLFLDLDNYKDINDSLGHVAGDQLLVEVGRRLTSLVRGVDTVARVGGDEFIILLHEFPENDYVTLIVNRVMDFTKKPFLLGNRSIYITASIGVVTVDSSTTEYSDATEIMRDADLAMYTAKSTGKARYIHYQPSLRNNSVDRVALDADLHQALEQHEFTLYYQPVMKLGTPTLAGFEALIRWNHPVYGLIAPSEFIPLAESNGLIDAITRWVLRTACLQLQEWLSQFPRLPSLYISVNISPNSLWQPNFATWVNEALSNSSVSPDRLVLEIVETALIQDVELAVQVFSKLRAQRVRVGLDDFGIGYSSLAYIKEYPIDVLKIDRSFTSHVTTKPEVKAVVRAVVTLARELNVGVIAEGIETADQLVVMKEAGCEYGQGNLFSEPLSPENVWSLLLKLQETS